MLACAAACYPGAKLAHLGSFIFCLFMDKNDLYELLGLCAIFFPFFSFCLRIYAQIIKKFNAYAFSFFFRLSDQSEKHFMYILCV